MKFFATTLLLLATISGFCQGDISKFTGKYSDYMTTLELKSDSTFVLKTPDDIFPYSFSNYQTSGNWKLEKGNNIILNPEKSPRKVNVALIEKTVESSDSITIKINYQVATYENEILNKTEQVDFNRMTLYVNKPRNYYNLVCASQLRLCLFAPRIKKQYVIDSTKTIKLPKQQINKIGINTYGFEKVIELTPKSATSNYFEITIIQPFDKEGTQRSRAVIIKGKNAFFYKRNGKVSTSGLFLSPLKKS